MIEIIFIEEGIQRKFLAWWYSQLCSV